MISDATQSMHLGASHPSGIALTTHPAPRFPFILSYVFERKELFAVGVKIIIEPDKAIVCPNLTK